VKAALEVAGAVAWLAEKPNDVAGTERPVAIIAVAVDPAFRVGRLVVVRRDPLGLNELFGGQRSHSAVLKPLRQRLTGSSPTGKLVGV